jgi:hypothetical protein
MDSEESIGMANDNMGPSIAAAATTPEGLVSNSRGRGFFSSSNSQEASESDSYWSQRGIRVEEASSFQASKSESSTEIRPEGANWTIGRKLAKLRGI